MATGTIKAESKWRYLGGGTGTGTAVSFPNDDSWSEVYIEVYFSLNENLTWVWNRPRIAIPANGRGSWVQDGSAGSDSHAVGVICNIQTGVKLREYIRNSSDISASTKFNVWIR